MHGHLEGLSKLLIQNALLHCFNAKPSDEYYHPIALNGGLDATGLLASFNVLIHQFCYPVEDRSDKPKPLKKKAFEADGSITWTAAMTLTFLLNASLILAGHVDQKDPVVQCFLMHCFYFSLAWHKESWTWDDIVWLDGLILDHHQLYARLWPDSTIPKFHWILHMAMDIWRCGPIRHITCMRCKSHSTAKTLPYHHSSPLSCCIPCLNLPTSPPSRRIPHVTLLTSHSSSSQPPPRHPTYVALLTP